MWGLSKSFLCCLILLEPTRVVDAMALRSIWSTAKRFRSGPVARFGLSIFVIASWVPVVITFTDYVAEVTSINGPSMYPFLNAEKDQTTRNDLVFTLKFGAQEGLKRGMIVTFWNPYRPECTTVKRIVGVAGDTIRTREPYPVSTVRVPVGHIWVEGDGEDRHSQDSNHYGPISTGLVIGKVTHILWPFHRAGKVRWWEHAEKIQTRQGSR
ncbi:mitochondrial inner membrane protease subunit-like protein [Xylariaceae sp. FL0804]|nr:mitochondrial inner membrane protease subunit-like protein [Xylariaceae sp. FL0804]